MQGPSTHARRGKATWMQGRAHQGATWMQGRYLDAGAYVASWMQTTCMQEHTDVHQPECRA